MGLFFCFDLIDEVMGLPGAAGGEATAGKAILPEAAVRDMLLGAITLKYTQSNSVGFAMDGQMVGVGAGQQSRVDCVKLAGRKVACVRSLVFSET